MDEERETNREVDRERQKINAEREGGRWRKTCSVDTHTHTLSRYYLRQQILGSCDNGCQ
jgi:hypothetical protein